AIQGIAEERLTKYADRLEAAATKAPVTRELFESWLAARELLDGKKQIDPNKEIAGEEYVAAILKDAKRPPQLRTLALRMLRPDHPLLTPALLSALLREGDAGLQGAVVRAAMLRADAGAQDLLRRVAADELRPVPLRALAIVGLSQSAGDRETRAVLKQAITHAELRADVERSL